MNDDVSANPSVMLKYIQGLSANNFQVETNIKLHTGIGYGRASYRYQDGYAAMLGVNVSNTFNVGYAYDFTTTNLNTESRTHEIVVGFLIGNKEPRLLGLKGS